ncbi:TRF-Interacting Factor 2 [Trypanosoma cruzi]|nr:TRF-Interacting Factor 2 [Trypanosoma cruzi]
MERVDTRRYQSFQLLELFIDLIHGDLIRGDVACRRVADAFVSAYEDAIRWLVTEENTFTPALKGAINTYCARHVIRTAPELLIVSEKAVAAYKQIADVLFETEELSHMGKAMAYELSHLKRRLETKRFSRLVDLMADVVVAYMQKAFQQHEEAKASCMHLQKDPAFWVSVEKFCTSSTGIENEYITMDKKRQREEKKEEEVLQVDKNRVSKEAPVRGFSEELRLAISSPIKSHTTQAISTRFIVCAQPSPSPPSIAEAEEEEEAKRSKEPVKCTGRALLQANDSVLAAVEGMGKRDFQTAQDFSSGFIVADDSGVSLMPAPSTMRKGVMVAGGLNETAASLLSDDVHVRSYVLCAKTNRYEPQASRGSLP